MDFRRVPEKDFLDHYVQHHNSTELNATHYKVYEEGGIKKWADKAGIKILSFCPKMYQGRYNTPWKLTGKKFYYQ